MTMFFARPLRSQWASMLAAALMTLSSFSSAFAQEPAAETPAPAAGPVREMAPARSVAFGNFAETSLPGGGTTRPSHGLTPANHALVSSVWRLSRCSIIEESALAAAQERARGVPAAVEARVYFPNSTLPLP